MHDTIRCRIFQSTLPREERRIFDFIRIIFILFQSTLPREERPVPAVLHPSCVRFQSTLPREERLNRHIIDVVWIYFNPRSHERSDMHILPHPRHIHSISIHAPTRGATAILHKKFVYFYTIPTINI